MCHSNRHRQDFGWLFTALDKLVQITVTKEKKHIPVYSPISTHANSKIWQYKTI